MFNNVGSHGNGENAKQLYEGRKRIVEKFCKENAFKLIVTNSNIMNEFDQNHYMTHTYTSCFAILCLQKLFSIYYYASGRTIDTFSIKNVDKLDSAYFDFLLLDVFSSNRLRIYSEGANSNRLDKIQKIVHYKPDRKSVV